MSGRDVRPAPRGLAVPVRLLLLVAAALLASTWPGGTARPDLVVLVVVAAALVRGPATGVLVGLAGGWLVDLVPPGAGPAGGSALVLAAVGGLVGLARPAVVLSPVVPWVLAVLAAGVPLLVRGVSAAAGFGTARPTDLLVSWGWTAALALVLVPALLALERRRSPLHGRRRR
ncbi:MAG TPA: rod shape-determining protein MreD [Ornithinimicrobium sp.]|nr:rod shape-determining protein MreD [Ornithinimicrobium sp.]